MKFIKKSKEPQLFSDWKAQTNENWQPSWENFQAPQKREVHDALLQEQGYICCYCGMRISRNNSHIEHLQPRTIAPNLALEYPNLLASCQGENETPIPAHCGHKKGNWYKSHLMVSPLAANCQNSFRYTDDGQIVATDNPAQQKAAETTIERLGLNIDKLRSLREKAIEPIFEGLDELTDEDKQTLIQGFEEPNAQGQYEEFWAAIAYFFNAYSP